MIRASGTSLRGRAGGVLLASVTFLILLPHAVFGQARTTGAQPGDWVELQVGGGRAAPGCGECLLAAFDVGVTFWGRNHWGISARHEFSPRDSIDSPYSSLTARRRWLMDDGTEFDLGFGITAGSLVDRKALIVGFVPLDLLVGRKLSRHIGVKGGYSLGCLYGDGDCLWRARVVGFAVIGF